ncbi:orotidine-5'-phosphate decarboxylase [Helicobacter cappadocius]|uniref:Orotidine 5'-phosphate decarboxylase n=1 Tax=Helicobacter cappadocius TaxID=3063998 RepID=A0AA90SSC4_9HELI|nr:MULTISPECIES: orotidine-5'-phosphate decarboxylase [unclassified Helicobacter]MDO7253145.1 orotidine-5'-phosphate decarboxylase [Helicobacter sp. faydin-H75]MDP2538729.1 orotidine-5'-phosphate decarboxylase [Helicobacter sp. faydin-H76]
MQLCVALDLEEKSQNIDLLKSLKGFPIWVKVGLRSYIRDGRDFIEEIKKIDLGFKIFLDLKLYDIPNTMADAALECAKLNIDMMTLHASSGKNAMMAVMERLGATSKPPLVFAVSALTSFDSQEFQSIYNAPLNDHIQTLAKMAFECNLDGAVCSVHESKYIKKATDPSFLTLTPGIRPFSENNDDQKRVADIDGAKEALSDFIVIGRPIYKATNPKEVVERILEKIK